MAAMDVMINRFMLARTFLQVIPVFVTSLLKVEILVV